MCGYADVQMLKLWCDLLFITGYFLKKFFWANLKNMNLAAVALAPLKDRISIEQLFTIHHSRFTLLNYS